MSKSKIPKAAWKKYAKHYKQTRPKKRRVKAKRSQPLDDFAKTNSRDFMQAMNKGWPIKKTRFNRSLNAGTRFQKMNPTDIVRTPKKMPLKKRARSIAGEVAAYGAAGAVGTGVGVGGIYAYKGLRKKRKKKVRRR